MMEMLKEKECGLMHIFGQAAVPLLLGIVIAYVVYYLVDIFSLTILKKWANIIFWVIIVISILYSLWRSTAQCRQVGKIKGMIPDLAFL